jgi:hypothetical protein
MAITSVETNVNPDYARVCFCNKLKSNNLMIGIPRKKKDEPKETCEGFEIKRIGSSNTGILNYDHLSLRVYPVNFCYGRNGKYKSYLTYFKSNIKEEQDDLNFSICKNGKIG